MPYNDRHSGQRGFTLVELLVAISIMAIVAVLGWRGLDTILRSRAQLNGEMEQTRSIQLAFAQLENDCAHMMDPALFPGHTVLQAAGSQLHILRSVLDDAQPVRYQVVTYRVSDGVLRRSESLPSNEIAQLSSDWEQAAADDGQRPPIALQDHVAAFTLRSWRQGDPGWQMNGQEMQTASQAAVSNQPGNQQSAIQNAAGAALAGLEVSILLEGQDAPMVKVMLLGSR